jgi:DNA repair photolyase
MKRFTKHTGDQWGEFLDIKEVDLDTIHPEKYTGKTLLLSSVTDPYCPLERKYRNTRRILEKLTPTKASVSILTKSKLVTRDIDLFQQFSDIKVGISLNTLDPEFARIIEPAASKPNDRIQALKTIAQANIPTYVFISPIFPLITDWKAIIDRTKIITRDFRFENLNFRSHNISKIMNTITQTHPQFVADYEYYRSTPTAWNPIASAIEKICSQTNIHCKIEFHHGGFTKKTIPQF